MTLTARQQWLLDFHYRTIQPLIVRGGPKLPDVRALNPQNDPFNVVQAARMEAGAWFGALWKQFSRPGMHLRGFHYVVVSLLNHPLMRNGRPYENTPECWRTLQSASKDARYLEYVEAADFTERRTREAAVHATARETPIPQQTDNLWWHKFEVPTIDPVTFTMPIGVKVTGYDYQPADQPFTLEVWVEKSTMHDILDPLCRELGITLVTNTGFSSITRAVEMVRGRSVKPVRIFYVSDYDKAGRTMPIATARQIEFWLSKYAPDQGITLIQVALTAEQVEQYGLPKSPDERGEDRTELDALEALHPGELERIIREAVAPYIDTTLKDRLKAAETEAMTRVNADWHVKVQDLDHALRVQQDAVNGILQKYADAMRDELAPHVAKLEEIHDGLATAADTFEVDLPSRPTPDITMPDESDVLFDSARGYFEQLTHYKAAKS